MWCWTKLAASKIHERADTARYIEREGDGNVNFLILLLSLADGAAFPGTWKGHISDLKCGAMIDAACNRRCLDEGQSAILVTDGTGELLPITNTESVKKYAGAHVEVKGTSKDGQITVKEVRPLEK